MKIERTAEIYMRVGDGRSVRIEEQVSFEIDGAEIMQILKADFECETEQQMKTAINLFAQFVKAVPDEMITALSPDARRLIAGFLQGSARRFLQGEPAWLAKVEPATL